MAVFVLLTTFLIQKGSPESRRPGVREAVDVDPQDFADDPRARGRSDAAAVAATLRELARPGVRVAVPRVVGGSRRRRVRGVCGRSDLTRPGASAVDGVSDIAAVLVRVVPELAERVPIGALIVPLAVYLRQRYSPESKPVHVPQRDRALTGQPAKVR